MSRNKNKTVLAASPSNYYPDIILNSLSDAIIAVDGEANIIFVNAAAEQLLGNSYRILKRKRLDEIVPFDSPLLSLVTQVRLKGAIITEYDVNIGNPNLGVLNVDVHVSPLLDGNDGILVQLQNRSIAKQISKRQTHRSAARSVSGMAEMLAHEIKNPLSGIKGSAQILSQDVSEDDKPLTNLICEEVDRICTLLDRMEVFTDHRQLTRNAINIHSVLEHVKTLAENGFGKHIEFIELYDPSLPETVGDRGALIQVFLNLLKNASEAVATTGGKITMTTAYRQGVHMTALGTDEKLHLPLEVCVIDNGGGISNEIKENIFDPFVTTKVGGSGFGLAIVTKIVGDLGGIIECESDQGKTIFRILLPAA